MSTGWCDIYGFVETDDGYFCESCGLAVAPSTPDFLRHKHYLRCSLTGSLAASLTRPTRRQKRRLTGTLDLST